MPPYLTVAQFESESGLVEDRITNKFHFRSLGGAVTPADAAIAHLLLSDFYNLQVAGVGGPLASFLSPRISRAPLSAKFISYGVPETPLGDPILTSSWTPNAAGSSSRLPGEVAVCLSILGEDDGTPRRRRLNRIYVGPLINAGSPNAERPDVSVTAVLRGAAARMRDFSGTNNQPWVAYSGVGNNATDVEGGWTDDAWDTQRKRGIRATAKTPW